MAIKQIFALVLLLCSACQTNQPIIQEVKYSLLLGLNKGGITENTEEIEADAFSGATRTGFNIGLHANKPLPLGELETGIDFMHNLQLFTYADEKHIGERKLNVNQLMIPVTYNINLLKRALPSTKLQLKLGYNLQFNMLHSDDNGQLPPYSFKRWSNGVVFGISANLLQLNNGSSFGFYTDFYRGSRIYTDYYNNENHKMPGSSFAKYGIRYTFK